MSAPAGANGGRAEVMVATGWVMTVSTFQLFVIVVLAATLIAELGLTRWQIGALGAVNTGVGAVVAPALGKVVDRLGARRSQVVTVVLSAVGLAATAAATTYPLLVAASAMAGLPQGAGNSVTNRVIAEEVPAEGQGAVTGVKQSGVQLAVFLAGGLLPLSNVTVGWRWVLTAFAVATLLSAGVLHLRFPNQHRSAPATTARTQSLRRAARLDGGVYRVAVYAFLLGTTAAGVTRFYPLFAEEVLGFSEATAGLAVSVMGLTAIVARVVWAWLADRVIPTAASLRVLAVGSTITTLLMVAAEVFGRWVLWPAVVLAAFTVVAWNVVAMLAVIRSVPVAQSGRATGVVLMGFLSGLTVSAPLVGLMVDRLGSYQPAWYVLGVMALAAAFVVSPIGRPGSADPDPG